MNEKPFLTNTYIGATNVKYIFEYHEVDSFEDLPRDEITQCYAVAFHSEKIVIVHNEKRDTWGLVGGSTEEGETIEETLIREIKEESNMAVLKCVPIGYQKVTDTTGAQKPFYQLRYFAIVEPLGPFETDPAGTVDKMLEVETSDYKKYFDWGEIGDAIVGRALELKKIYDK